MINFQELTHPPEQAEVTNTEKMACEKKNVENGTKTSVLLGILTAFRVGMTAGYSVRNSLVSPHFSDFLSLCGTLHLHCLLVSPTFYWSCYN